MPRRARRLAADFLALATGELFAKIAGFLAFAYLARVLGPDDYGAVEFAVALAMLFGLVVDFGFGPIGSREVTGDPARARALAASIPAARAVLALAAYALLAACVALLDQPPAAKRLAWIFGLSLLALPWTLNWLFQGLDRMGWVAGAQALRMGLFAGVVVLLVRGPADLWKVGAAEIVAAAAMAAYFVVAARWRAVAPGFDFQRREIAPLVREAWPVAVSQVFWALNQYLPTLVLAALVGGSQLAFYGSGHRVVVSLGTFTWLYFFNLYPSIVRTTRSGGFPELARHSFRATSWAGIGLALAVTLGAEPIARLAYGDSFAPAGASLAILAWVLPVSLLSGHARFALIGAGHQKRELWAQAGGVVVTLGLAFGLVPALGATGAAWAMLGSAVAVWLLAHAAARLDLPGLPFAGPALRPAAAAGAAVALAAWLPADSELARVAAAVGLYAAAAPVLEPRLLRDLRALLQARTPAADTATEAGR